MGEEEGCVDNRVNMQMIVHMDGKLFAQGCVLEGLCDIYEGVLTLADEIYRFYVFRCSMGLPVCCGEGYCEFTAQLNHQNALTFV